MKNHNGCSRGYHRSSKAWYAKHAAHPLSVSFGMYHSDGSTSGEMNMQWESVGNEMAGLLRCYEDSWSALALFPDLVQRLGELDSKLIQEPQFVKLLDELGFKDLTEYNAEGDVPPVSEESTEEQLRSALNGVLANVGWHRIPRKELNAALYAVNFKTNQS